MLHSQLQPWIYDNFLVLWRSFALLSIFSSKSLHIYVYLLFDFEGERYNKREF